MGERVKSYGGGPAVAIDAVRSMNLLFSSLAAASNVTNGTNVTHTCSAQTETVVVADYVLAACAVVVLAFDIWQLVRLLMISRETGLAYNGKRVFHAVLGVSLAGRAVFFFVAPSWCSFQSEASEQLFVWSNHTLEVLFFCAFFLLLIFWMELISSLRREPSRSAARCQKVLLGVFVSGLVAMALIFLVMLLAWAKTSDQVLLLDLVFAGLVNLLEILAAVMFCIFGFILYRLLRKHDQLLTVNVQKKKQMARNIFI